MKLDEKLAHEFALLVHSFFTKNHKVGAHELGVHAGAGMIAFLNTAKISGNPEIVIGFKIGAATMENVFDESNKTFH